MRDHQAARGTGSSASLLPLLLLGLVVGAHAGANSPVAVGAGSSITLRAGTQMVTPHPKGCGPGENYVSLQDW